MIVRILLAGVLAGVLMFVAGAIDHMVFQWEERAIGAVPDEDALRRMLTEQGVEHGVHRFPAIPHDVPAEQYAEAMTDLMDRYREGPSGLLIVAPRGEEMMTGDTLGRELATNVALSIIVATLVSWFGADVGFVQRWLAVVAIGVVGWLALSASHHIWYRFAWPWVRDELYCVLFEFTAAGLPIAALVRRRPTPPAPTA